MKKNLLIWLMVSFFILMGCALKQHSRKQDVSPEKDLKTEIKVDRKIGFLDWIIGLRKPVHEMTLKEIKKQNDMKIPSPLARFLFGKYCKMEKVENKTIRTRHGEIPIRIYYPSKKPNNKPDMPLIMFFHGGGWVLCGLDNYDRMCRRIARDTGAILISVGYHLAPWHKYPVALEDCYDATLWALEKSKKIGADPDQLIVMGDSAGGNLSASVCLMARNLNGPDIKGQILLYPNLDATLASPSIDRFADAPMLTKDMMVCFINYYARTEKDKGSPYFSPLLAEDLNTLPPALVITAQYDPLHDEGQAYAGRLKEAGNLVQVTDYPGMVHGFILFPEYCKLANKAYSEIADYVKSTAARETDPDE
jgi:acetyl esterase